MIPVVPLGLAKILFLGCMIPFWLWGKLTQPKNIFFVGLRTTSTFRVCALLEMVFQDLGSAVLCYCVSGLNSSGCSRT